MIDTGDVKKGVIIELDGQLMKVLDWKQGFFELSAGVPSGDKMDIDAPVVQLLLEHAQSRDEADR